jgi:acetyl esterase/lipase
MARSNGKIQFPEVRMRLQLILCVAASAIAQTNPAVLVDVPVPPADQRLSYGSDPLQFGELRLPKTKGPHPVAILVHGGCWADRLPRGEPRITTYELLRPMASALAEDGVATWNIEYRRAGNPGGGWPNTYLDLSQATDFLRTIAKRFNLDLARVVVAGHSSGGQFALWIAARSTLAASSPIYAKDPLRLKAAINIDGPSELAALQPQETKVCGFPAITNFIGGGPSEVPERYRDGSIHASTVLAIPQKIVVGGLLKGFAETYVEESKAKGNDVTAIKLEGSNHFDMLDPATSWGKTLRDLILSSAR